jgi:hypothetical protein
LQINDLDVHRWELGTSWTKTSCRVPAHALHEGLNEVCVLWPDPRVSPADQRKRVVAAFTSWPLEGVGFATEGHPVYGDVFAFDEATAS